MSRSAASSCALVNSGGEPFAFPCPFSCPDSFATLFLDAAAMAIPDERDDPALSNPTQTAVEGSRRPKRILLCRTAAQPKNFGINLTGCGIFHFVTAGLAAQTGVAPPRSRQPHSPASEESEL